MNRQRVVITGIGVVTPLGTGREDFWAKILLGHCAFQPVSSFDTEGLPVSQGAEIRDFDPTSFGFSLDADSMGRASQLAVAASRLAIKDARLAIEDLDPSRLGVAMGTTSGEPLEIERYDDLEVAGELDRLDGRFISLYPCHMIAVHVAADLALTGPVDMIPTACAAGNYAIARAFDLVRSGRTDAVLAGGADCFSRITYRGFARLGAIAPEVCQPFDRDRKGMIPGEGAGVLVLEPLERALERGAPIYAEVLGYGLSCDAHHMTGAHPDGPARAMRRALASSSRAPEDVDYISAHGTGTPTNDRIESEAVKRVFGESARRIPISSIKSMIGHTMGAASAIEAAACTLAVACNLVPPTMNFKTPDPECDLDCVPNSAREHPVEVAMNNAYAFGGNNASVLFGKYKP